MHRFPRRTPALAARPAITASLFVAALAALAALAAPAPGRAAPKATPLTVDDVGRLRQVTGTALSPDGRRAAFVVEIPREGGEPNGPAWKHLFVQALDGASAPRAYVTGQVRVEAPAFSPDGRFVGFLAKRGEQKVTQVWAIPVDGGEARPLTRHPGAVEAFAWLPGGDRILYVAAETPTKREEKLSEEGYEPEIFEEVLRDQVLWMAEVPPLDPGPADAPEPAEGRRLTGDLSVWQLDVPTSGGVVVLGVSRRPLVDEMYMAQDVHVLELPAALPAADAPPLETRLLADPPGKLGNVRVSPDGRHVAYTAAATRSDHAPSQVFVVPLSGGPPRNLTPPDYEGHAADVAWWDADTLLWLGAEGVWTTWNLVPLDAPPGSRTVVYHARETGVISDLPVLRPDVATALFVGSSPEHPRELFAWTVPGARSTPGAGAAAGGALRRLSDSNPWLAERTLGRQEVVRYEARDGLAIEGILIHPVEGAARKPKSGRPPLVVDVHGGPESHIENGWVSSYFHPGQVAAGRGWAVFYPNYRGSTGRGVAFAAASFGDPAGAEFEDIVDGIRHLTGPAGLADPQRVGLIGGSYGGFAANWFATKYTELVRAVVSFVGVSNLVSKRLLTDIPQEDEAVHMGAPVREQWELMLERSPIRHAAANRTAVLLLHGAADPRVHPAQSQELYRALKQAGHPAVRLVFYPGEGHGNRKRSYRLDTALRTLDWLEWYVAERKPVDGPLPPADLSDRYGIDLPEAESGDDGGGEGGDRDEK